jgi:hypothetical protein
MPVSLKIHGILELKQALAELPAHLKGQATAIVMDTAQAAANDIRSQYPLGSPGRKRKGKEITPGNLRKGVKVVVKEIGPVGVAAQVRSAAPHAPLYEFGTEARHYITKRGRWHGTGAMWGKRPGKPVFIPTMIRYRRLMYRKLAEIIEKQGLTVKLGDEAA